MKTIDDQELSRRVAIVTKDYGGIILYCEVFYIQSILYAASRSLDAFYRYESTRRQNAEADFLISTVQEAIGHAAALSRFFWLSALGFRESREIKTLRENRGAKLRKSFDLDDTSPLKSRSLTDAWEHFDERLDTYLLQNDAGCFFPNPIIDSHTPADDPIGKVFKLLDPEAGCLVLMGRKFFFKPIKEEVKRIFEKAISEDGAGGRLMND